jgi:hypothetical protein
MGSICAAGGVSSGSPFAGHTWHEWIVPYMVSHGLAWSVASQKRYRALKRQFDLDNDFLKCPHTRFLNESGSKGIRDVSSRHPHLDSSI